MKTIENGSARTGWVRRAAMGTAFAVVTLLSLGAATSPAHAYWYHGYWHGAYWHFHPHYYGWYGYGPAYYSAYYPGYVSWGWGWHGGWGWHHGWHRW